MKFLSWRRIAGSNGACLLALALLVPPAHAQSEDEEEPVPTLADAGLTPASAADILAQPLPEAADSRYALLEKQYRAAQLLENRALMVDLARQLVEAGRGRPGGEGWIRTYVNAEFTWGSSGKAFAACDPYIGDSSLTLATRASVALRQTYFAAQGRDRRVLENAWSRADDLVQKAGKQGTAPPRLAIERLQVRAEIERWRGDLAAAVATLREAVGLGRREVLAAKKAGGDRRDPRRLEAYAWLDGSLGMLSYALVNQGRPQEAIEIAQTNLALWRAGELSDGLGARWSYRLASALNAVQQFAPALGAAQRSDDMLQRAGASAASHTRWLARREIVRALIGLRRWKEADESYRDFIAAMPADLLARTRASDSRLLALLAAKNGRLDEALEQAERFHRIRLRLYGDNHPQTQEAAGVRAVVRLLRGDIKRAMSDYETLFAATLDSPGGWLDLDQRGVRGYVLGIAFSEFMHYVAERTLQGERLDPPLIARAFQVADRSNLGVTQRALSDSTARLLAATPALRTLLEQEQNQRQTVTALFATLNATLGEEDQLRRETQTPAFKESGEAERKAHGERLRQVRERIKTQQAEVAAAREGLKAQRAAVAEQFPAYADLVTPTMPSPEALRKLLAPGEAVLAIHPTAEATFVWLIGADRRDGFHVSRLNDAVLAQRIATVRAAFEQVAEAPAGRTAALPLAELHALYRDLLAPLGDRLGEVHSLLVAAQGSLASLPLATLLSAPPDGEAAPAWLVRRMAVSQLPSPSAVQALRRVPPSRPAAQAMSGFGDPLFKPLAAKGAAAGARKAAGGGELTPAASRYDAEWGFRYADIPPLPETRAELQAVAAAVGANAGKDLVFGAQATRRAVLAANLLDRRVVAFATHGLMPGELPGVAKPALAMAATADERESPLLELDDVLGLRLNAQWVLLSACNTAAGEQGGAAMSGLVRGFFFAGARSVLATHWAVESESAAALSAATFRVHAQGAASRSDALRQAQLAMIDGELGGGRWRHPYYWAPYALFGDPLR